MIICKGRCRQYLGQPRGGKITIDYYCICVLYGKKLNKPTSDCIVKPGLDQSKGFICPAQRLGKDEEVMFGEMVNRGSHKMLI